MKKYTKYKPPNQLNIFTSKSIVDNRQFPAFSINIG